MFGWDYETYQRQPANFIREIIEFQNLENFAQEANNIQAEQRKKLS